MKKSLVIAVAGASGSGKTFLADHLCRRLASYHPLLFLQDNYYRERSDLTLEQRQTINYDHPDAIEFSLLVQHLQALKNGQSIRQPLYDFSLHNRKSETVAVAPAPIIIIDGILLLAVADILPLYDLSVFVETPQELCFIRRLQRDTHERGRTVQSVIDQYLATVRPMYQQYVYPSRVHADLITSGDQDISLILEKIISRLRPEVDLA